MSAKFNITLLFNANKNYDKQIIQGIGEYIQAQRSEWNIYMEEDFTSRVEFLKHIKCDGIIADLDIIEIQNAISTLDIPVVGTGGSYFNQDDYPNVPYVATDNNALIQLAFKHLSEKGLQNFAFYGLPKGTDYRWAHERCKSFNNIIDENEYFGSVYLGHETNIKTWQNDMDLLAEWIINVPKPIGIIAVTDARARLLLQVCDLLDIMVPEQVSIIGIDNEALTSYLTKIPLSSIEQGGKKMGYQAAKWLHKLMLNPEQYCAEKNKKIIIPPVRVIERQSTDYQSVNDPYVIRAMHFIRHNAYKGIKVDQVLDYVGISRSNLENRFKSERIKSIHQEIHDTKLKKACYLLKTSELSVEDIAYACGYQSPHYLYAVFKKDLDSTPNEYRKLHKED